MRQENEMSVVDIFGKSQQTFEEAQRKISDESGSRSKHFRMQKDDTYRVRVMPLAPVLDKDGNVLPMERKGYEYPVRNMVLKITGEDGKGKEKHVFVNVCNANYAFPDLKCDLIDTYVSVATEKYAKDEALVKKIKSSSFDGGLKWNSGRSMYILDADKRSDGIQILDLSYSQYKDLEDRKMQVWEKLLRKNPKTLCPVSSIDNAYCVEIKRKTDNKKTEYTFNIDTVTDTDELDGKELKTLLDMPRLPEVLYRYTRFHLEATIAFLRQFDKKLQIDVMDDDRVTDCIDKIKMTLPSDDTSHFTFDGVSSEAGNSSNNGGIEALWDAYDHIVTEGLSDRSEEGQDLRAEIKKFIEDNDLEVTVSRGITNKELLEEIEDALNSGDAGKKGGRQEEAPKEPETGQRETGSRDRDRDRDRGRGSEEREDDADSSSGRSRSDDTSEPAERPLRRANRPERRQR
jgi:hypothetical protein